MSDWQNDYTPRMVIAGKICGVHDFMYTAGLCVGLSEVGYEGRYCYGRRVDAVMALQSWSGHGDPPGPWIKYKGEEGERLGPGAVEPSEGLKR